MRSVSEYSQLSLRCQSLAARTWPSLFLLITASAYCQSQHKITATDARPFDLFGTSVSIDANRAVIGAPLQTNGGVPTGALYVVQRQEDGSWVQEAKLIALDSAFLDWLGSSVSISGDRIIVGAPNRNEVGPQSGTAYVFRRRGDSDWVQEAKLLPSDGAAVVNFGVSVAIRGHRAVVGARSDSGSAYVFQWEEATGWLQEAKLAASDAALGDGFGEAAAISGDHIVVGAPGRDDGGEDSGAAYVFSRHGRGNWIEEAKLTASNSAAGYGFGAAVAISSNKITIGAPRAGFPGLPPLGPGAVYVFSHLGKNWLEDAILVAEDAAGDDQFGESVAIDGDRVVVGNTIDSANLTSGAVYVFRSRGGSHWMQEDKLKGNDAASLLDLFGHSVSISESDVLVGSPGETVSRPLPGAAYVFRREKGSF